MPKTNAKQMFRRDLFYDLHLLTVLTEHFCTALSQLSSKLLFSLHLAAHTVALRYIKGHKTIHVQQPKICHSFV